MSCTAPPERDLVIGYAPDDGSLDVFQDYEEVDGCLQISGVVEAGWTTFYRLDGEKLTPRLGQHDWVEQLDPTGSRDLEGLVRLLTDYARTHGFDSDGSDPSAFVAEMVRRDHQARWPQLPRWLDRWIHADGASN